MDFDFEWMYNIHSYIRPDVLMDAHREPEKEITIRGKDILRIADQIQYLALMAKTWKLRAEYEAHNYQEIINSIYKKESNE